MDCKQSIDILWLKWSNEHLHKRRWFDCCCCIRHIIGNIRRSFDIAVRTKTHAYTCLHHASCSIHMKSIFHLVSWQRRWNFSLDWLICVCRNTHSWFLQIKLFFFANEKGKKLEHDLPELFCVHLTKFMENLIATQNTAAAYVCLRMGAHIWNRPTKLLCFMFDVGAMYHICNNQGDADPSLSHT